MRSLTVRLILAFLAVSLVGAVLSSLFARISTAREFDQLVVNQSRNDFINTATAYYEANQTWVGISEYQRSQDQPRRQGKPQQGPQPRPMFALADATNRVILEAGPYHKDELVRPEDIASGLSIVVDGKTVGTVLTGGVPPTLGAEQEQFLARSNQFLLVGSLGAAAIAIILGLILARTLAHPLRELTTAIRAMASGQLNQQVRVRSQDEIGELAASFNQMSGQLQQANQLRRQMTADIAHDLRTPLTVVAGYVESMRDGVLAPNAERFEIIYQEMQHLQHLVEDLRMLSLADAGELRLSLGEIAPAVLLERVASAFQHEAEGRGIALQVQAVEGLRLMRIDVERMAQVLGNLVSNALRYTREGGWIRLAAQQQAGAVVLMVSDNGVGIAPEALPHIFERFYRADQSRHTGGTDGQSPESGLGLAIARSIVEAHGGTIAAHSDLGHGTTLAITLPAAAMIS